MSTPFIDNLVSGDIVEAVHVNQYSQPIKNLESGAAWYRQDSGTANAVKVDFSTGNVVSSYTPGLIVNFKASAANTGAATLTVTGPSGDLAAVALVKQGGTPLAAGDINSGQVVSAIYTEDAGATNPRFEVIGLGAGTLAIADGGTGATTAADARTNLGVQAQDDTLDEISTLSMTKGDIFVHDGSEVAKLGPGSNGQVLSADSTETTGLKWVNGGGGSVGPQGDPGPTGPQGPAGADGATGPVGPQGPTGATGPAGPAGVDGSDGAQGPAGATGPQGPAGADGATGSQGPAGPQGATGAQGPVGPAGPTGATGAQGPAGATTPRVNMMYVGKHGNDSNDGLTPDSAKLTIGAAITAMSSVTTYGLIQIEIVDSGVYAENVVLPDKFALVGKTELIVGTLEFGESCFVSLTGVASPGGLGDLITFNPTSSTGQSLLDIFLVQGASNDTGSLISVTSGKLDLQVGSLNVSRNQGIALDIDGGDVFGSVHEIHSPDSNTTGAKGIIINSGTASLQVSEINLAVAYDTLTSSADLAMFLTRLKSGSQNPTGAGTASVTTA